MTPSKSGRFIIDGVPEFKDGVYQGIRAQGTISGEMDFVKLASIICKESKPALPAPSSGKSSALLRTHH